MTNPCQFGGQGGTPGHASGLRVTVGRSSGHDWPFPMAHHSNSRKIQASIRKDSERFGNQPGQSWLGTENSNANTDDAVKLFRELPPRGPRTCLKEYAQEQNLDLAEVEDWLTQLDPLERNGTDAAGAGLKDALTMRFLASWDMQDPQDIQDLMFLAFRADMRCGRGQHHRECGQGTHGWLRANGNVVGHA